MFSIGLLFLTALVLNSECYQRDSFLRYPRACSASEKKECENNGYWYNDDDCHCETGNYIYSRKKSVELKNGNPEETRSIWPYLQLLPMMPRPRNTYHNEGVEDEDYQ